MTQDTHTHTHLSPGPRVCVAVSAQLRAVIRRLTVLRMRTQGRCPLRRVAVTTFPSRPARWVESVSSSYSTSSVAEQQRCVSTGEPLTVCVHVFYLALGRSYCDLRTCFKLGRHLLWEEPARDTHQ